MSLGQNNFSSESHSGMLNHFFLVPHICRIIAPKSVQKHLALTSETKIKMNDSFTPTQSSGMYRVSTRHCLLLQPTRIMLNHHLRRWMYLVVTLACCSSPIIIHVHAQATVGSSSYTCTAVEGFFTCATDDNFPFASTPSALLAACIVDTIVEPSSDVCSADCLVVLGRQDTFGRCQACTILPDSSPTDGTFSASYDCSNIIEGSCVGRTSAGACIDNTPANAPENSIPDANSFTCGAGDVGSAAENQFGCLYTVEPFPFTDRASFVFALCDSSSVSSTNCQCGVFLGTSSNAGAASQCAGCIFVPDSAAEASGGFQIAFDCR
jgi:hypothetical protein